jgi:hypothetical protein
MSPFGRPASKRGFLLWGRSRRGGGRAFKADEGDNGDEGDVLRSRLGGHAADFYSGPAEVYEQAQGLACRSEVVSALREMHVEFDDDLVLDQQVGGKFANDNVVVKDDDPPLLDGAEPALSHFVGEAFSYIFSTNP